MHIRKLKEGVKRMLFRDGWVRLMSNLMVFRIVYQCVNTRNEVNLPNLFVNLAKEEQAVAAMMLPMVQGRKAMIIFGNTVSK